MLKRLIHVAIVLLLTALPSVAQEIADGFYDGFYQSPSRRVMQYRLFLPDNYNREEKYPLIIWLHGLEGAGDDNMLQIQHDQFLGTHFWTSPESQAKHPAFVVAPQSARGWTYEGPLKMTPELGLVFEI